MPNNFFDTTTLTTIINQCFILSADGRVSAADQQQFLIDGKRLRGLLLNLLSAQFDITTNEFTSASATLQTVNTTISSDATVLGNVNATLGQVTTLIGSLDTLLGMAASFL